MIFRIRKREIRREEKVEVGGVGIDIRYKNIRNIHLRVLPPDGRVLVTAPFRISREDLLSFIYSKTDWINKNRQKIIEHSKHHFHEFRTGETHYYLGKKYEMNVVAGGGREKIILGENSIKLFVKSNSTKTSRKKLLDEWYREQLKEVTPDIIKKWERILNVRVNEFGIKQMKTRWGTCNTRASRIWLNLELAKKPIEIFEYIIVHEMIHLLERSHNHRFKALMSSYLPNWKNLERRLKTFPEEQINLDY